MFKQRQFFGCCCNLDTGTKIIGIIGIIYYVLEIIYLLCLKPDLDNFLFTSLVTSILYAVVCVIGVCSCISLLYGTITKRKAYINAWLIVNIIYFIIEGLIFVSILTWLTMFSLKVGFIFFIITAIIFVVYYHIIYSVNFYYRTLVNGRAEEKPYTIYV